MGGVEGGEGVRGAEGEGEGGEGERGEATGREERVKGERETVRQGKNSTLL